MAEDYAINVDFAALKGEDGKQRALLAMLDGKLLGRLDQSGADRIVAEVNR